MKVGLFLGMCHIFLISRGLQKNSLLNKQSNGYLRPTRILKGRVASSFLVPILFLLQAPLEAASERVPRKSCQGRNHCKAKGCASARVNCSLHPHCSPGRRGPASAGRDAFPDEILE